MGKFSVYAVAYGEDPVTHIPVRDLKFKVWRDCLMYINEVQGANFKGFHDEIDADMWLLEQDGRPRAYGKPISSPLAADPNYRPYQEPPQSPKTQATAQSPPSRFAPPPRQNTSIDASADEESRKQIKMRFSERCMELGLDPNSILYYLMTQWCNNMDDFGFVKAALFQSTDEDDDDYSLPWD